MNSFIIPAYRITYNHFMRRLIVFLIFWAAVLLLALYMVLKSNFSSTMCGGIFATVLLLDIAGLVMFVSEELKKVEHAVNCLITEEGITLTSSDENEKMEEIFIPYTELFEIKKSKNPFDAEKSYLRIIRKKVKEEVFVYSDELDAYEYSEAEKIILEKIKSAETIAQ